MHRKASKRLRADKAFVGNTPTREEEAADEEKSNEATNGQTGLAKGSDEKSKLDGFGHATQFSQVCACRT